MMMLIAALIGAQPASLPAPKRTTYVEVEGGRYRVTVVGDEVEVAKKALTVRYSIAERDRLRAAVRKATGCSIVDELTPSATLRGRLDCSARP